MGLTWFARFWKMLLGVDGMDDLVSCLRGGDRVEFDLLEDSDPSEEDVTREQRSWMALCASQRPA